MVLSAKAEEDKFKKIWCPELTLLGLVEGKMREACNNFIGQPNTEATLRQMQAQITAVVRNMLERQDLSWRYDFTVSERQNGDSCDFQISLRDKLYPEEESNERREQSEEGSTSSSGNVHRTAARDTSHGLSDPTKG